MSAKEGRQERQVGRGATGRWRRRRVLCAVGVTWLLLSASCGDDGSTTAPSSAPPNATEEVERDSTPTPVATLTGVDPELVGVYGAGASDGGALPGYLEVAADGTGRWRGYDVGPGPWGTPVVDLELAADDDALVLGSDGHWGCDGRSGRYAWTLDGETLRLRAVDEPCSERAADLTGAEIAGSGSFAWFRLDPVPVLDATVLNKPTAVDSPFGTIEWVQLPARLDQVTAVDAGFVAVVADQSGVSRLVASSDGRSWEELEVSWASPRQLTAAGGRLYAVGDPGPGDDPRAPVVAVSLDSGRTWNDVALPPLPDDVEATGVTVATASAGGAGLAISAAVERETSQWTPGRVWIGDGETFEILEPELADLGAAWTRPWVQALDTGFIATAHSDRYGCALWRSSDGRTWERIELAPDVCVSSVHGDTIVLTTDADDVVLTSTDGGRAWRDEAAVQPVGGGDHTVVFERGYLAVETAIFGPAVGVVWASTDGSDWQRILNPWPPPYLGEPVVSGDVIVIPAVLDPDTDDQTLWVGTLLD